MDAFSARPSANHTTASRQRQRGFTLIEVLIAIGLISIMAAVTYFFFRPSKSKGEILFSAMHSVSQSAQRFAMDTSCYPYQLDQLFNASAVNGSTANSCGTDLASTWDGPYMKAQTVDSSGNIRIPQISPSTVLKIGPANPAIAGMGNSQYAVIASNVPEAIALKAFRACAGGEVQGDGQTSGSCHLGTPSNGMNTVEYVFAG